jgi:two-component system, OmpR family, KDP operon response regulator KdpE
MATALAATILIIDAERPIRQRLRSVLREEGYIALDTGNARAAMEVLRTRAPDLILFDINMPSENGPELCKNIRLYFDGPLIVISARRTERHKVLAFDCGADDYVVKPFGMQELLARIRILLGRVGRKPTNVIDTKLLCISLESRLVAVRGKRVHLGPKEFGVLKALVLAGGKPVTVRDLLRVVWGRNSRHEESVRSVVYELRQKLELPNCVCVEPGVGYRFVLPE